MAETMVERVARAIDEAKGCRNSENEDVSFLYRLRDLPAAPEDFDAILRVAARAAIAAMRKPTHGMLKAACAAMSPGKRPTQKRVSVKAKHGIRYRAMIDTALKEGE